MPDLDVQRAEAHGFHARADHLGELFADGDLNGGYPRLQLQRLASLPDVEIAGIGSSHPIARADRGQRGDECAAARMRSRPVESGPVIDMQHHLTEAVGRQPPPGLRSNQGPVRGRGLGQRLDLGFQSAPELRADKDGPGGVAFGLGRRKLDFRADLACCRDHVRKT